MFVRKSQISHLIRKEKNRERKKCEIESLEKIKKIRNAVETEKKKMEQELRGELNHAIQEKDREIKILKREIERNYLLYQDIRKREMFLNELTAEIENVVELMVVKVQESLQPFYRTRAKIDSIKRKSDRKHEKVENILTAVK
ncbi:MAG TPA: hypothetical protein PK926_06490 [Spirochaetota bacterium]|nr:hypothetical protein [Spirochaetota bacterium]HPI89642.1 hypothetical protein [Spirochaetota bacterium]HPR49221.1 hypothetical protein [Spirochaetota bacterium]